MERDIIEIDEDLCNGCGQCIPGCHEGALQIIDGKARLISDFMCDGLGACLKHCPQGAMKIERHEVEEYNETKVMENMISKGFNTVIAHLKHLKEHNELALVKEAVAFLQSNPEKYDFDLADVKAIIHVVPPTHSAGCPGSQSQEIKRPVFKMATPVKTNDNTSELRQWPVQMHLINTAAAFFKNADMVLAADCVPFAMGNFHQTFLKNKVLGIACPKLDTKQDIYLNKLIALINDAKINSLHVVIMKVPCCNSLLSIAKQAISLANRKVPLKKTIISIDGNILAEEWV